MKAGLSTEEIHQKWQEYTVDDMNGKKENSSGTSIILVMNIIALSRKLTLNSLLPMH
jgi:hypothetical protein